MKKLGLVLLIFFGYWWDGQRQFSERNVRQFLLDQAVNSFSGNNETVCNTFSDDVEVKVEDHGPQGRWEVEGGKDEICGYLRQASASFLILKPHLETTVDDLKIQRAGFPWTTADITYQENTSISAGNGPPMPPMVASSDDRMTLKRTLRGLRITRLEARSRTTVAE